MTIDEEREYHKEFHVHLNQSYTTDQDILWFLPGTFGVVILLKCLILKVAFQSYL
jgi:hypothetical protein